MLCCQFYVVLLLLICKNVIAEPITVSLLSSALLASSWYKWDLIKDNTYCRYVECCNDDYIPYDIEKLRQSLSQRVFGQPLVSELANIVSAHKQAIYDETKRNKKALVISLHGWSGVGKNYATTMVAEALYRKGIKSKYVKLFMGKKDFSCTDLEDKKKNLVSTIEAIVKKCPKSLIIFDEIHDMCPSILDVIKPMFDHYHSVDGVDYRDSIFILISNIGGQDIASNLLDLYTQGVTRNDVQFHDFEPILRRTAYFQGGFKKADAIAYHLIDHYIPFLPLEQKHVEKCAELEFKSHGILEPTEEMMAEALSVITYGPTEDQAIFANNGCKRFTKHIPYIVEKYKRKTEL